MVLWNALIPEIFHGPVLTYWQTMGLLVLSHVFFRGGHFGGGHRWKQEMWQRKMKEKMEKMSPEEKEKKRRKKLKELAVEYKGGKCCKCNYDKCIGALEFHHLDSNEKDFGIAAKGHTVSWERMKLELDKCIMVCANCHREIHEELKMDGLP